MPDVHEAEIKRDLVREYMSGHRLSAVLLTRQNSFAWFTCGGDNHVVTASDMGAATLVITPQRICMVTSNIESARMAHEELAGQEIEVLDHPWHDEAKRLEMIASLMGVRAASDDGVAGTSLLAPDFVELRYSLTQPEIERYRALGRDCGEVIGEVTRAIEPGDTELEVAGHLASSCLERNIVASVTLVAADGRTGRYRHPIPKQNRVEKGAMVVLCGRRHGLVCSATRLVHFGRLPGALVAKHRAAVSVDAAFNLQTVAGARIGDIFANAQAVYEAFGIPEEWKSHHQGGPTGYAEREFVATPGEKRTVQRNQAYAWNPSIRGTKSEDTILATKGEPELFTASPDWPILEAEWRDRKMARPDILIK